MRLVIQGPHLDVPHIRHLSRLCGALATRIDGTDAYRIPVPAPIGEIPAYCEEHGIDCAFVPDGQTLDRFGLVVMDMDSTLIGIECIDEIADMYDLKPQVAAITESAMRGDIEFAESLRRRVALLAGLEEAALARVYDERLRLNPGAGKLIGALRVRGIRTLLVSGGFTYFTERLKARLDLDYTAANRLEIVDGRLAGRLLGEVLDAQAKADWLVRTRDALGLKPEQVIAIGDGANDLRMLATAGVGIAYHAKPVVRAQATYALNHAGLDGVLALFID